MLTRVHFDTHREQKHTKHGQGLFFILQLTTISHFLVSFFRLCRFPTKIKRHPPELSQQTSPNPPIAGLALAAAEPQPVESSDRSKPARRVSEEKPLGGPEERAGRTVQGVE